MLVSALDLGSFTSVWFWIALAVFWTFVLNFPMGVSSGRIARAEMSQEAADALDQLVYLIASPWLLTPERQRILLVAVASWSVGLLLTLAFIYGSELALGLVYFVIPCVCVAFLTWHSIRAMAGGVTPLTALKRLRFRLFVLAITSLFLTALHGGAIVAGLILT